MGKLIQIIDGEQKNSLEVECAPDALYFRIKCYDSHEKKKYRIARIKMSDAIYQTINKLTPDERSRYCLDLAVNGIM